MSSANASPVIQVKKIADCCKDWQCNKTLVQCLDHLFTHGLDTDVTFLLGRNGENVKAHSFILKARSPVLCKLLSAVESQQWKITLFRYSKQTITMFLRYIYTDMVTLTIPDAVTLVGVARQFKVNNLVDLCEVYLRNNAPKSTEDVTAVMCEDDKQSKPVQNTRVNTCETEDRIESVPPEVLLPHEQNSVVDVSSALPASKFLLELKCNVEHDDKQKSEININSVPQTLGNLLKRRQTVDSTAKPAEDSVTVTLEGSVMTKRRCVTDAAPRSPKVSSVLPVHQPGSKQQHVSSVSKPSDSITPALPINCLLSHYTRNKIAAITNLTNSSVDEILGKTSVTQPQDDKVSSTTHLRGNGVEVKYQRQNLRYNFVGKTSKGPHDMETISGTTSQEQHLGDKVTRKTSQEQYLGKKISRKKPRGKTLAQKSSKKTFLGKQLSDEILGKTSQRELLVNDIQGKELQGQNLGDTSSKVITRGKRRKGKNLNTSYQVPCIGNNSLDSASCGQPDSAKITVGTALAVCNGSARDLTKSNLSSYAGDNSSNGCIGNSNNGRITKNDTTVDPKNVTSTKSASDNQTFNGSGVSGKQHTEHITDEEHNIAGTDPVVSDQEKSSIKEQIDDLKCQIEHLKADIINNHGYLEADDHNSSPNSQEECTIVAVENGTSLRGASDTDDADEGGVLPTDQVVIDEENRDTPLDLTTAPCIRGTKKATTSIQPKSKPNLQSFGVCSIGENCRPQTETVQENTAGKSEKVVRKKRKKTNKKRKKKGKKILNEATVIKTVSVMEETANKKRHVGKNLKYRQQIMKEESKKPRENVKTKKISQTHTMTLDKCEVCGESFNSAILLLIHMREHAGEQNHQCALCGKGFTLLGALKHHMQKHKEKELMRCRICGKWYASKTLFKRHCNAHKGTILKCKDCGLICETKLLYDKHMKKGKHKMTSLPYKCRNCSEEFEYKRHLIKHNKIHIKGFKCEVCDKILSSKPGLKRHSNLHKARKSETKNYKCKICTCVLDSLESLSEHSKIHKNSIELDSSEPRLGQSKIHEEGQESDDLDSHESQTGHIDCQESKLGPTGSPESQLGPTGSPESQLGPTGSPESQLGPTGSPESQLGHMGSLGSQLGHTGSLESQLGHTGSLESQLGHMGSPESPSGHMGSLESQLGHLGSPKSQLEETDSTESQLGHTDQLESKLEQTDCLESLSAHTGNQESQLEHADHPESPLEHADLEKQLEHIERDILTCDLCSKSFDNIENLEAHQKTHQAKDVYECILCKKMFLKKCYLDRHYKYHSGDQYFSCDLCDEGFDKKKELLQHQFTAHNKKMAYSYSCSTCSLVFKSHKSFRTHMLCHSKTSQDKQEKSQEQT